MQNWEKPLNEKLLQVGNPNFWGKKYSFYLLGGKQLDGTLVRANWSMKFGKVVGYFTVLSDSKEESIQYEKLVDILPFKQTVKYNSTESIVELKPKEINPIVPLKNEGVKPAVVELVA